MDKDFAFRVEDSQPPVFESSPISPSSSHSPVAYSSYQSHTSGGVYRSDSVRSKHKSIRQQSATVGLHSLFLDYETQSLRGGSPVPSEHSARSNAIEDDIPIRSRLPNHNLSSITPRPSSARANKSASLYSFPSSSSSSFHAHARYASDPPHPVNCNDPSAAILHSGLVRRASTASTMSVSPSAPPNLRLPVNVPQRKLSVSSTDESFDNKPPKSPSRFTSFFGRWQSVSSQDSTVVPGRDGSPTPSPKSLGPSFRSVPPNIDTLRANSALNAHTGGAGLQRSDSSLSLPPLTPAMGSYDNIEEELRLISAELAASIRREMELEDLVEKLELEAADANAGREKRTSDYFSDIGTPIRSLDYQSKRDQELEKLKRSYEQEKAQVRLEMVGKVSDERQKRLQVETHLREIEDQVSRGEYSQLVSTDAGTVVKLQAALEDARRKLAEEKAARENFEVLATAIREEMEQHRKERDRLRDEVVPKLRQRVLGLEAETSQIQQIIADRDRFQKELAQLRDEHSNLLSMQNKPTEIRISGPAEKRMSIAQLSGLSTSNLPNHNMIAPPLSPKEKETLADKLKDVEAQRDELHKALRSLRQRQLYESQQAKQKIRALEVERDRALRDSPRKYANDREIMLLRREVDRLRQRAEDAIEAKFACERNLGSLKTDLERAEQETATLRVLLQEHDSLINQHEELKQSHTRISKQMSQIKFEKAEANSMSLQRAYRDLQLTHELTLSRLDNLEAKDSELSESLEDRQRRLVAAHDESERAMKNLRQSLAEAEAERDAAQVEAEAHRKEVQSLHHSEREHLKEEQSLSSQLRDSTVRVRELADQVDKQMESNAGLRARLAAAIDRGEKQQETSANRINDLQARLKTLEERVVSAQQETDDALAAHEEEIRAMKDSHHIQLTRFKSALHRPTDDSSSPLTPGKMPLSPLLKSPRLDWATKLGATGPSDSTPVNSTERVEFLEKRVMELEKALGDADNEMEEVVARMSLAQIEVMELTAQRDEATRMTRKLQADIAAEREKFIELLGDY